jgi:hypothetical protein
MQNEYGEQELARIEAELDGTAVPMLVRTLRQHQHDLDALRLRLDVATRDRQELRDALLGAQAELRMLRRFVRERGAEADYDAFRGADLGG